MARVVFSSDREDRVRRLWQIPASGGPAEKLTDGAADFFRWSSDGKRIYFVSPVRGNDIWELTLDNGHERRATRFSRRPGNLGLEGLAVADRYLYFTWENDLGDIWVADVRTEK
jgi:Tol biopolymer transport system component